jgi:capsid protein
MARAFNVDNENGGGMPTDDFSDQLAKNIIATTNKQTFNMSPGSTVKAVESKQEMFFEEFYKTNANIICAAIGIPPNVAFSLYTDSFSASRAATKDWEHTMNVEREDFQFQFYQRVYDFWLHFEVLNGRIDIPGYLQAFYSGDVITLEAIRNARFTGAQFPHIDPLKEVQAERLKLGDSAKQIPLTTVEMATEALNGGDSNANIDQFSEELKKAIEKQISVDPTKVVTTSRGDKKAIED